MTSPPCFEHDGPVSNFLLKSIEAISGISCRSSSNARATSGSWYRHSHVTLTVMLTRLLVLRSCPRIFEKKRDCSQSTLPIFSTSRLLPIVEDWGGESSPQSSTVGGLLGNCALARPKFIKPREAKISVSPSIYKIWTTHKPQLREHPIIVAFGTQSLYESHKECLPPPVKKFHILPSFKALCQHSPIEVTAISYLFLQFNWRVKLVAFLFTVMERHLLFFSGDVTFL